MTSEPWHKKAACLGLDTSLFFAEKGDHSTQKTAMFYCNGGQYDLTNNKGKVVGKGHAPQCEVREQCLEWALRFPADQDAYGIFGGMTPHQRDRIRANRKTTGQAVTIRYGVSLRGREPQAP